MTTGKHLDLAPTAAAPRSLTVLGHVDDDWQAAEVWLQRLSLRTPPVSKTTVASYRTELRRLRWYVETFRTATPSAWTFQDAMAYLEFLHEKAAQYQCVQGAQFGEAGWTPFKRRPAPSTIANSKKVLSAMYAFWQLVGHVSHNPFAGMGRGAARTPERVRSLPPDVLELVYKDMEARPRTRASEFLELARNRFILRLIERTGLRAAEAVLADMDDIEPISDPKTGRTFWALFVRHGKGNTTGHVLLDDLVMQDLRTYRKAFGLEETPTGKDRLALILSLRTVPMKDRNGREIGLDTPYRRYLRKWGEIRRRQSLWDIVKGEFSIAATSLKAKGLDDEARRLTDASTHWLRHTFGTRLVLEGKDIRTVAQAMRHKHVRQTMIYTNQEFLDVARALSE